ncbi:MAG: threonylcarbamoyl-AMP synthase [Puniceicoccales bacterium]|nr:threonylcarbamoyl-AMP synthase [Puniceicoccales bacterium]
MVKLAEILNPTEDAIGQVVDALLLGEVVALPTETVYGLAGIISNDTPLEKIFEVKERPLFDPLIVHVLDFPSLRDLVDIDSTLLDKVWRLADIFCPGPLTFVLRKKKIISHIISAGKKTVAIRIPAHPVFREVLRRSGPLAAPSANPFGYVSPTCAEHVQASIGDKIPYILDGGPCEVGVESTILDLSRKHFTVLRPGAITAEMIENVLGEKIEPYHSFITTDFSAPGMLKQHYSPQTKLRLFKQSVKEISESISQNIAIIYVSRKEAQLQSNKLEKEKNIFWFSEDGDLSEIAHNMFALLQRLDKINFDMICSQVPEKVGIGIAINDRLGRAAAKRKDMGR